ncbi:hypothetical protein ACTXT7_012809 [Hymenolepis weldensis]
MEPYSMQELFLPTPEDRINKLNLHDLPAMQLGIPDRIAIEESVKKIQFYLDKLMKQIPAISTLEWQWQRFEEIFHILTKGHYLISEMKKYKEMRSRSMLSRAKKPEKLETIKFSTTMISVGETCGRLKAAVEDHILKICHRMAIYSLLETMESFQCCLHHLIRNKTKGQTRNHEMGDENQGVNNRRSPHVESSSDHVTDQEAIGKLAVLEMQVIRQTIAFLKWKQAWHPHLQLSIARSAPPILGTLMARIEEAISDTNRCDFTHPDIQQKTVKTLYHKDFVSRSGHNYDYDTSGIAARSPLFVPDSGYTLAANDQT